MSGRADGVKKEISESKYNQSANTIEIIGINIKCNDNIKDIDIVLKKYKIYRRVQQNIEQPDNYTIDHTSLYYLMDKEDNYIAHFNRENFRNSFKKFLLEKKFL